MNYYYYVVHRNSISLRESFQSKKIVYSESRDSPNSLIEVATQISSIKVCFIKQFYYTICLLDYSNNL